MQQNTYSESTRLSTIDCGTLQEKLQKRQRRQAAASRKRLSYDEEANIARLTSAYDSMMFVPAQINLE